MEIKKKKKEIILTYYENLPYILIIHWNSSNFSRYYSKIFWVAVKEINIHFNISMH